MATSPDILTGKDGQPFVPIEEKHGEDCTCTSAGRIELDLVMASRLCPGDRNPHRAGSATAKLEDRRPHEVHLVTWDGPIEWLELRFKPGVEVGADWGRRIAEAAKAIVSGEPGIPTRESVNRGEHTINQYREHHGIDGARPDLAILDETQAASDPLDHPKVRMRRGDEEHIHQFPAKEPLTVPYQYLPCECGETFDGGHGDGPEPGRS